MLLPRGPINAKVMIIVDYPSKEDMRTGMLLSGSEGRLLDEMLDRNGLKLSECFITCFSPKPLPPFKGSEWAWVKRGRENGSIDTDFCRRWMEMNALVERVDPHIVIGLGDLALHWSDQNKYSVDKWRGSLLTCGSSNRSKDNTPYKFMCTYHPRTILAMYKYRTIAEIDIRRLQKESLTRNLSLPNKEFTTEPLLEDVLGYISAIRPGDKVSFDIETVGQRVRCLALATCAERAICIPFMTLSNHTIHPDPSGKQLLQVACLGGTNGNYWTIDDERLILQALYDMFRDPSIGLIAQNYPFDSSILAKEFGFLFRGLHMDTLIAQHTLYPELPKSLDFMTTIYTRTPLYSDHNPGYDPSEWEYNCFDACITWECAAHLENDLRASKLWTYYTNVKQPAMIAYTRAQNRGIPTDVTIRAELSKSERVLLDQSIIDIGVLVGHDLNPNSAKQMKAWLYDEMKLPAQRNRKTGSITCDEKTLLKLSVRFPLVAPAIQAILQYRASVKMLSTFLDKDLTDDNKTLTTYNIAGTVTGRLSSSQTLWKEGVNITQTPKGPMRRMFYAPEDYVWIQSDLSQAEARFVFWDAGVSRVIKRFMDDPSFDIYKWNAAENIYYKSEGDVTKTERAIAKVGVLGGNYGLGYKLAAMTYGVSVADAKLALDGYHQGIPEIKQWWLRLETELTRTRTLYTPLGGRRQFLGRLDNMLYRSAYAYRPQSTIGEIIHRAFTYCDLYFPAGSFPLIPVHDEINCLVLKKDLEQCTDLLRKSYDCPLTFPNTPYPLRIPVEISTGPNWWDQKDI